jgi:lysine 6-dehydrogenase
MDKTIVVLGGYGEMGKVIVTDLAETFKGQIVIAGRSKDKAIKLAKSFKKQNIIGVQASSNNEQQMKKVLKGANVLINATNYYSNMEVMKHALSNNVNYVDLGGLYHVTKVQLKMHSKFKKKKLIAVLGCGSTPGITNVLAEFGSMKFDRVRSIDIAFADKDYTQYSQPFIVPYSMQTVFDEFTQKPAVLEKGRTKFVKPLSGEKRVEFPKPVGTIVCRYSLHSEVATLPSTYRDKGIRECSFRGGWDEDFVAKTKFMIDAGFANNKSVMIGNKKIIPREVAVSLLNRFMPPSKIRINDMEFLKVEIKGRKNGNPKKIAVYCKAFTNKKHNIPAGSWDTGVPPSIIAQEIVNGKIKEKGVMPTERCIAPSSFFKALKKRKMKIFTRNE